MKAYNDEVQITAEEEASWLADLPLGKVKSEEEEIADLLADLNSIGNAPEDSDPHVTVAGPTGPTGPNAGESEMISIELTAEVEDAEMSGVSETGTAAVPVALPVKSDAMSAPVGFAFFDTGTYETPADDNVAPVFICTPLRVDAVFSDQHGKGWGKLVQVQARDGRWHEIPVLNADLQGRPTDVIATLVDHGLELAGDKKSKDRLISLLKAWRPELVLQSVNCSGWVGEGYKSFVLGKTIIGDPGALPLIADSSIGNGLVTCGSLESWKQDVGTKCSGNALMLLAVSLAFSSPLLSPLGMAGGGLHFRGASSSGKTTLLNLAASVWGSHRLVTQWRATSNGLEAIAAARNDMLLPVDEIAEISGRDLHGAIYMLANGTGKARMTKSVALAEQTRWRLALISSGEISVEQKLKEDRLDSMAGHEVRLIDIEADSRTYGAFDALNGAASAADFAGSLQQAMRASHGTVGHEFVRQLIASDIMNTRKAFEANVRHHADEWLSKLPSASDGQTSRVARRLATIGLSGEHATSFGLTGWTANDALNAAREAFLDWYDRRYGGKHEAAANYVKDLKEFLAANENALVKIGSTTGSGDPIGWCDPTRVYLSSTTWEKIFKGQDGSPAAKALMEMHMLQPGDGARWMRKAPRWIPGRPRVYTINIEALDAYQEEVA